MIQFDPKALVQSLTAMTELMRAGGQGAATLVQVQEGALSAKVAIGPADLDSQTPATTDQTYEIGSQTKMMTSVMVLQLVEKGLINLDAPAASYLPADMTSGLANADTATVRELLNMTAGIPNYTDAVTADGTPQFIAYMLAHPDSVFGPEQALAIARDMAATNAPGEAYYYSNTNYALLGQIVERLTGQSFIAALQTQIFDPAGMTSSVRQLSTDDPRLHSYASDPSIGGLMDVTRVLWEMQGEAGVASNTTDMIAFLQALLVDHRLLGPEALAQMMTFLPSQAGPGFDTGFGLGLLKAAFTGDATFMGFAGGTLGTDSSTFLNVDTGMITAIGTTHGLATSRFAGVELSIAAGHLPQWAPVTDDGGPIRVASGSAAEMTLQTGPDGMHYALGGATLTLHRTLEATTTHSLTFADGSVLVVGDNKDGAQRDALGNTINIAHGFASALYRDNHLMGLDGNDKLSGGYGNDRIEGGRGADLLNGRAGDDLLQGGEGRDALDGGTGNDTLEGGAGNDTLAGGAGDDAFVFLSAGGLDLISDFQSGHDHIDLHGLSASGHFIGTAAFTHSAGEVRQAAEGHHILIQQDTNGDGAADLTIRLFHVTALHTADFIF